MEYIAHIRESDKQIQTVEEHLLGVKRLAEAFGEKLGVSHIAGLAGLLHDAGKFSHEFLHYIQAVVYHPEDAPRRGSVDHSTAGGKLLFEQYHQKNQEQYTAILAELVGNAIISHHSYLHDFLGPEAQSGFLRRVRDTELPSFAKARALFFQHVMSEQAFQDYIKRAAQEVKTYLEKSSPDTLASRLMFLGKVVFSILIDADRTHTRQFENNEAEQFYTDTDVSVWVTRVQEERATLFAGYYEKLLSRLEAFKAAKKESKQTEKEQNINRLRREMSEYCEMKALLPSGIHTLSIPTGGGKTLASFRYALRHAMTHSKQRIIFIVPFTTIIEQNAEEIRSIIQDDGHLLEHHSNVMNDIELTEDIHEEQSVIQQQLRLAKDNWDSPIIFTTMVQFLNVFYAKGSRNIRRLHNLASAVVIFDEVQKVPVSCVSLFNYSLNYLQAHASSTIVLCTATQPALDAVTHRLQLAPDAEIVANLPEVVHAFKRVEIVDYSRKDSFNTQGLADWIGEQIGEQENMLIILNTKAVVKALYEQLATKEELGAHVYHLSTAMCPAHRRDILEKIKKRLDKQERVICISTQLIEAGVDISFRCVVRSLAGLDSIAQAAGRCNRHGERELGAVYLIDHLEEKLDKLDEINKGKSVTKRLLADLAANPTLYGGHLLSPQAMTKYFREFYMELESDLNYSVSDYDTDMIKLLMASRRAKPDLSDQQELVDNELLGAYKGKNNGQSPPLFLLSSYRTAAEQFEVIKQYTQSVIVPYGTEGKEIIAELNGSRVEDMTTLLRKAQQYTVNLYQHDLRELSQNGGLISLFDNSIFVLRERAYSDKFGVDIANDSMASSWFF